MSEQDAARIKAAIKTVRRAARDAMVLELDHSAASDTRQAAYTADEKTLREALELVDTIMGAAS